MTHTAGSHASDAAAVPADLVERQAVADLLLRLAAALDEHRYADLGEIFTPEACLQTPGGTARGRPAVIDQARRTHGEYRRLQHRMTNVLVDVRGSEAELRADAVARFVRAGPEPVLTVGGVYRCRAVRVDQGWRFAQIEIDLVWRVDVP